MRVTYTASEARARFSEVMRKVREGNTIVVTYRGEPVAEIRPLEKRAQSLEERTRELERAGGALAGEGAQDAFQDWGPRAWGLGALFG